VSPPGPVTTGPVTTGVGTITVPVTIAGSATISFQHFLSYEYEENYLHPSDSWSFTLSADETTADQRASLVPGAQVEMSIDDNAQSLGYIDKVRVRASRGSGAVIFIEGRDWMSPAVDSQVDPQVRFKTSMTLLQFLQAIFGNFGMQVLATDNVANRNIITGRVRGTPTSKKSKVLSSYLLHEEKPYPNEGAYAFASRVAQRFGLWIRPSVTFGTLVVGKPDYDQEAQYTIHQRTNVDAQYNNVLDSDVEINREEQFSTAFASGFGGGGDLPKSSLRTVIFNPSMRIPAAQKTQLLASYPGIPVVNNPALTAIQTDDIIAGAVFPMSDPNARPVYLYDPESKTLDQLQAYVLRELSLRMRKGLTARYTIEGHKIGGVNLAVDTIVDVDDDISNLHRPMWVLSRRFSKVAGGGTTTQIELIRPQSLQF